jgi:putative FmdB family regulatory protein
MATYPLICTDCGREFQETDEGPEFDPAQITCPECGSDRIQTVAEMAASASSNWSHSRR